MSPEAPPPPVPPDPPDQTLVIFHLRQGSGPNSDSQVKASFIGLPEEVAKHVGVALESGNKLLTLRGVGEHYRLIACEYVAWIEVKPLTEREYRRLREQLELSGVR